jgi:hypothetical protein
MIMQSTLDPSQFLSRKQRDLIFYAFPSWPETTRDVVDLCFWHSLLMTATTPLFRMMHQHWRGENPLFSVVKLLASSDTMVFLEKKGWVIRGLDYAAEGDLIPDVGPMVGIDIAFALHSGFSLLWMVVAYVQIRDASRMHSDKKYALRHKYFGYFSAVSFALHVFGAANTVNTDTVRHTALPKLILLLSLSNTVVKFAIAIGLARQRAPGWRSKHQDYMVICYLNSLNGAGPIRTIAQLQLWFGCGPVLCQKPHMGIATQCQVHYTIRLVLIGLFTMYALGMYVKARNNDKLTLWYTKEARLMLTQAFVTIGLGFLPHAEWTLHQVFGEPRSLQCHVMVGAGVVAMIVNGANEYRTVLRRVESPTSRRVRFFNAESTRTRRNPS